MLVLGLVLGTGALVFHDQPEQEKERTTGFTSHYKVSSPDSRNPIIHFGLHDFG